jgi:hypothetical protein
MYFFIFLLGVGVTAGVLLHLLYGDSTYDDNV